MKWENKGHELYNFQQVFQDKYKMIFCGCTQDMIDIFSRISAFWPMNNILFCDEKHVGEQIGENIIYGISDIQPQALKESIVVITTNNQEEIFDLRKYFILCGLIENKNFFTADIFKTFFLPIVALYAYNICYVEFIGHTSNYACTLRCKACSASTPYLHEKNPTKEEMMHEIDILFSKVDYVHTYDCTGGETFLVSDKLVAVLRYLFDNYSNRFGEVLITTNATVLPTDMMINFLQEHKERIRINVSFYPTVAGWDEKYKIFTQKMQMHGISITTIPVGSWIDFGLRQPSNGIPHDKLESFFNRCGNFCRVYTKGKIWYCAPGHLANVAFYGNDDDEAIDLSAPDVTPEIIIEFMMGYQKRGYLNICAHCNGWGSKNNCYIPIAEQLE